MAVLAVLVELNSLYFALSFSRWLYYNLLTELPGGLLNATTQLQIL